MAGQPILPNHPSNPVGGVRQIRRAVGRIGKHLAEVRRWLLAELDALPVERLQINTVYQYQISVADLQRITDELARRMDDPQMHGFVVNEVSQAYAEGTARAVRNLSVITDDYTASITAVLRSQPYLRRQALMQARVFEQMQGFTGDTARDLARVLRQGIENGQNPLEVAKTIRDRFGVSHSRAKTIARTEITGALRRARLDEAQETEVRLGLKTKMLWFSALSPTTRESHAERHGNLYTPQEVRNFYSVDGNAINCQCSQTETLVDDEGNPLTPQVVERTREIKRQWLERQAQEAS